MLDLSAFKAAQLKILDDLGSPCHYKMAKAPETEMDITSGFKTAGVRDEAITLSYGVGAKILTVKASDFATPPIKYDEFRFHNTDETYIAEAVHPIHIGAEVTFFKIFIKGK